MSIVILTRTMPEKNMLLQSHNKETWKIVRLFKLLQK